MAESQAQKYVRENLGRYSADQLAAQLRASGYPEAEISAALSAVNSGASAAPLATGGGFFDFKTPRTYHSLGAKAGDFAFGFFGVILVNMIASTVRSVLPFYRFGPLGAGFYLLGPVLGIAAASYLWKRRRWISYGIITLFALFAALAVLFIYAFRSL